MDLGLVCPEMTGHLNPSLALGRELFQRGHRVRIITTPGAAEKIAAAGLEHLVIGQSEADAGEIERASRRLGSLSSYAALLYTTRLIVESSRVLNRDLPPRLREDPCDALLVDQVCPAGAMIAEDFDLPYLVICNALAIVLNDENPPATTPLRYSRHPLARLRNRLALKIGEPIIDALSGARGAGVSSLRLCRGGNLGLATLTQQPPGFDFPANGSPQRLDHTGPWHSAARDDELPFPWDRLDDRPLIFASLGTIQNQTPRLFRMIIDAVRGLDAQLVLSLGRREAVWAEPLPENVIAVPYAPQLALLARATLAITHAGLNTALECLAAGVPMLCLPITNDQPGVARRVEWVGAGKVLLPRWAKASRIRRMIEELLIDDSYRESARRFQAEIARTPGPVIAADLIERVLGTEVQCSGEYNELTDNSCPVGQNSPH